MRTNKDISGCWFGYSEMTIPKGTRVTKMSACGPLSEPECFINDLSWVPKYDSGLRKHGFIHDATYYGIRVSDNDVDFEKA